MNYESLEEKLKGASVVFGNLFIASNRLQTAGDKIDPLVSIKQWLLVAALSQPGSESLTLSQIGDLIGSSRQNVKKLAVTLEEKGFVKLQRDEYDSRSLKITLTKECLEHFKKRDLYEKEFITTLFDSFTLDEIKSFSTLMSKLISQIAKLEQKIDQGELTIKE